MSRDDPQANGYTEEEREQILHAYHEHSSLRGLSRTFVVSRNTVTALPQEELVVLEGLHDPRVVSATLPA